MTFKAAFEPPCNYCGRDHSVENCTSHNLYSDSERHDYLSQLNHAELFAMASEWIVLYSRAGTGELLARVDEYLTEQCDRAYVAYYRVTHTARQRNPRVQAALDAWQDLGDAREVVRRPLREMRQRGLKGTKTMIHASKILGGE